MLKLFYITDTASLASHIVLNRLGVEYELVELDFKDGSLLSPDYLRLNPNKRVPTLIDGDFVLFESAAICMHLADSDAQSGLLPPLGSQERAECYKWMMFLTNTMQADIMLHFYKQRFAKSDSAIAEVATVAAERVTALVERLEGTLSDGRQFLSGQRKTIVEDYLLMLSRWVIQMGLGDVLRKKTKLHTLLCKLDEDDAVKKTYAKEGIESIF